MTTGRSISPPSLWSPLADDPDMHGASIADSARYFAVVAASWCKTKARLVAVVELGALTISEA
jgi:hypothetical protein